MQISEIGARLPKLAIILSIMYRKAVTIILRLPPEMDLQFYFSNVPSDSNWNRLVLIKNEISARNQ